MIERNNRELENPLDTRVRLGILAVALLIMLTFLSFTSVSTLQAVRNFQQQYSAVKMGDVKAIHPWMTIHIVSHVYQVPEDYLCQSLHIGTPMQVRHLTLSQLATRKRTTVDQVIHSLQHIILNYRKKHPHAPKPPPTHVMNSYTTAEEVFY